MLFKGVPVAVIFKVHLNIATLITDQYKIRIDWEGFTAVSLHQNIAIVVKLMVMMVKIVAIMMMTTTTMAIIIMMVIMNDEDTIKIKSLSPETSTTIKITGTIKTTMTTMIYFCYLINHMITIITLITTSNKSTKVIPAFWCQFHSSPKTPLDSHIHNEVHFHAKTVCSVT